MADDSIFNRLFGQVAPHPEMAESSGPTVSHMGRGREADGTFLRPLMKDKVLAEMELNRQGSLMGSEKANQREFEAGSPILATIQKAIDGLNPMNWMGGFGGSAATITNAAGRLGRNSIGRLMKLDRDYVKTLHALPEEFKITQVGQEALGASDAVTSPMRKAAHQIQGADIYMGDILNNPKAGEVLGHELSHGYSLTRPKGLFSSTLEPEQLKRMETLLDDTTKMRLEKNLEMYQNKSSGTPMFSSAERKREEILAHFTQNALTSRAAERAGQGARDLSDYARTNYWEKEVSPLFGIRRPK